MSTGEKRPISYFNGRPINDGDTYLKSRESDWQFAGRLAQHLNTINHLIDRYSLGRKPVTLTHQPGCSDI